MFRKGIGIYNMKYFDWFCFSADAFIWGSEDKMEITADIYNDGEDSFNSFLYLTLPKEINYISANASTSSVPILCSPPSESNNRTLECDIGNPLPTKTKVNMKFKNFSRNSGSGFLSRFYNFRIFRIFWVRGICEPFLSNIF